MLSPPRSACRSDNSVLHIECVCSTAPAPRTFAISTWSRASAEGRPAAPPTTFIASSISRICSTARSPLKAPLAVIARRRGSRPSTALKLPLVPSTQPRASKRRPTAARRCAVSRKAAGIDHDLATAGRTRCRVARMRSERIDVLDVLRGVALLGMFLVHFNNGAVPAGSGVGAVYQKAVPLLFEERFWAMFGILFGVGFAVQLRRAEERGGSFAP